MDQQKEWMTTDLGHICLIYNHDPKHYKTICLFWSHVCFRAHTGILLGIDGRNSANSTNPIVFAEPQEGITPEDILEYKGRISLPHIDTNKMEITLDELKEYFDLLTKHKILQMKGNPGTVRFVLNKDYTQFMLKSHTIFVNLLKERMEFRWASVHRPEPEELEWYKTIFGNKNTKEKTSDLAMQFKSKKAKDSEQKKHCEKELMKYDKEIINDYDYLSKESDKLDAIPGFVDTILTFICHTDLLKLIRLEYDTLTKRLNF